MSTACISDTQCCAAGTVSGDTTTCETTPSDTERCAKDTADQATTNYVCWMDHRDCEVAGLFSPRFNGDLLATMEKVDSCLPCQQCRAKEAGARNLPKLRLGARERYVLLSAPGWNEDSKIIVPPEAGRAADEANRRAIRKLCNAGLIWMGRQTVKVDTVAVNCYGRTIHRDYRKRAVWLTPLGEIVVNLARDVLAAGRPIRWAHFMLRILAEAASRDTHKLLAEFRAQVEKERGFHQELARWDARMGAIGGNVELCRKSAHEHVFMAHTCAEVLAAIDAAGAEEVQP